MGNRAEETTAARKFIVRHSDPRCPAGIDQRGAAHRRQAAAGHRCPVGRAPAGQRPQAAPLRQTGQGDAVGDRPLAGAAG